jgi:chromosome segregation ATPase
MAEPGAEERDRIDELLRVNAELAAEIRSLQAGRAAGPRSAAATTARRLGRIIRERDALASELEETRARAEELARVEAELQQHNKAQHERIDELQREVGALRGGFKGFLRRVRSRVARSR